MRKTLKWILGILVIAAVIAILIVAYLHGRQEEVAEEEQEHPPATVSRINVEGRQAFIRLDAETQSKSELEIKPLSATTKGRELRANAIVLPVQNLTQLRTNYVSAVAQIDKAKAALDVSQHEYERLTQLYEDNQSVAAKTVQAAEGTWRSDQVTVRAATEALQLNDTLARQAWGEVVSEWLSNGSSALDRVLTQKELLLQVSLLPGTAGSPPKNMSIELPNEKISHADFVSAYPIVDSRIQSPSFLYLTPATAALAPGMSLVVSFPAGPSTRGVIVPGNAIVWWEGKAWTYVQTAPDRFARSEVSTDSPVADGWFVSKGLTPGDKVVVRGSQQLLSEEFRTQIQSLGEEGENEENKENDRGKK
jgi:hypothetical protein